MLETAEIWGEAQAHPVDEDDRAHASGHATDRVSGMEPVRQLTFAVPAESACTHDGGGDGGDDVGEEIVQQRPRLHRQRGRVEVERHRAQPRIVPGREAEARLALLRSDALLDHSHARLKLVLTDAIELVDARRVERVRGELCDVLTPELFKPYHRALLFRLKEPPSDKRGGGLRCVFE